MKYKAVKNPQLLTLVNPGKPPKKTKRSTKRAAPKSGGRKMTKAQRRKIALKNLKKAHAARRRKGTKRAAPKRRKSTARKSYRRNPAKRKLTAKQRAALAKGRAKRKRNLAKASARVTKKRKPRRAMKKGPVVSRRKARTKKAKRLGIKKQGWYPTKTRKKRGSVKRWSWVGNKGTKRRKASRGRKRQTAAQRRASLRNLKKARAAQRRGGKRRYATSTKKRRKSPKRRRRTYRRNQGLMAKVMGYVKPAIAGGVGFFGSRIAGNFIAQQTYVPLPESVRPYAPLAANIAVAVSAPALMHRVAKMLPATKGMLKYKEAVVVGALVAAVENIATMVLPASAQAYVAPPLGMGDALSVYERALSGYGYGGGMGAAPSSYSVLEADDGIGEYILEPGVGEYITEPGMGEYIEEPGVGLDVEEAFAGVGEYITEPGVGVDVEEAFADDYDLAGVSVEEAVAGLDGFNIQADEGLADHIYKNETGGGIFGAAAAEAPGPAIRKVATSAALTAMSRGAGKAGAARIAYDRVKAAMGVPAGNAALRDAVVRAVDRAFATGGGNRLAIRDLPEAPPNYPRTSSDWPVDGAPGAVSPIGGHGGSPYGEPTPVADPLAARVGGIFKGSIFSSD
jgi:hypothetical protein